MRVVSGEPSLVKRLWYVRSVSASDKHCSLLLKSVKIHICPSLTFEGEVTGVGSGEPSLVKRLWYVRSVSASDKHCS